MVYSAPDQGEGYGDTSASRRPATRGCICACGVSLKARAQAIAALPSRSAIASSLSRRSSPPWPHPFLLKLRNLDLEQTRPADVPAVFDQDPVCPARSQSPGMHDTASRHTWA